MGDFDIRTVFLGEQNGYGLTTASILYRMPDHPSLLQSFVWQFHDVAPDYPRLFKFLDHWRREIESAIHSVEIAHRLMAHANGTRNARHWDELH